MPQDSYRRKQEILTRAARTRVGLIDSCADVRRSVGGCVRALPVPARYLRLGAMAAGGALGAGLLVRLLSFSRRKSSSAVASVSMRLGRVLVSELLVGFALPLCRQYFFGAQQPEASPRPAPRAAGILGRLLRRP